MIVNATVLHKSERYSQEKSFQLVEKSADAPPEISENDFVAFLFESSEMLPPNALVWLSEVSYELSLLAVAPDGRHLYECLRYVELEDEDERRTSAEVELIPGQRQRVQYGKIFLNLFGSCEVAVEDGEGEPRRLGSFEVLPSKIRPGEVNHIFDYLLEKGVDYWQPFSLVKSRNTGVPIERQHLFWMLKKLHTDLEKLNRQLPLFRLAPRSRLTPQQEVVPWSEDIETTDASLYWLMDNLSALERTNNPATANLRVGNRLFNMSEVQVEYLRENTDIYENQIVHGYLESIREYCTSRRRQLHKKVEQLTWEVSQRGGLPSRQLLRYYRKLLNDCGAVIEQTETALHFFQLYLPVSFPRPEFPARAEGFETREHYRALLDPIQEWFSRDKDLQSGAQELFSGTRSMDKLYELYCLFQMIEAIEKMGFPLLHAPADQPSRGILEEDEAYTGAYHFAPHDGLHLTLYYERLPDTHQTALYSQSKRALKPDFIIEYRREEAKQSELIVFDAKYQTVETIRRFTYKSIIPKYLHGISRRGGGDARIRGLFLLHPEDAGQHAVESWHQRPYRWFDDKPMLPAIGRIEVPTGAKAQNQLNEVIQRIFEITE
ncbi:nuclease domain-containing protein [Persicitalea sp.]|uniref:nuclease domain-containing protein n=1 Tax=Persicitalea sp. TaxID=3100273 RepID=UPI003593699E